MCLPHPPPTQDSPPRVLQAHPRSGGGGAQPSSRASSRVLHLDPEFINTPGAGGAGATQVLEQSLETFLEREGRGGNDSELGLTPVRVVSLTPARIQAEVSVPTPPPPQAVPRPRGLLGLKRVCSASRLWSRLDSTSPWPPQRREKFQTWEKRTRPPPTTQVQVPRWSLGGGGSESKLSWTVVVSPRVQTPPSPGGDPRQRPPPQTPLCCRRLPSQRTQGPAAPPQPQPRHPQLHPAEPGPDLRARPRRRTGCLPDSRAPQPAGPAAQGHGVPQARVPLGPPAAAGGPDQRSAGKKGAWSAGSEDPEGSIPLPAFGQ